MKTKFNIKALSGSVVLVESEGFGTELFTPVIRKNRIVLLNVIENRRCLCEYNNQKHVLNVSLLNENHSTVESFKQDQAKSLPLSPPDIIRRCKEINGGTPIKFHQNVSKYPEMHSPLSISPINKFKVVPLFRNPTKNSPKKAGKLILTKQNVEDNIHNYFPLISNPAFKENVKPVAYSENSFSTPPNKKLNTNKKPRSKSPRKSITKWRKCITPLRTYSRKQISKSTKKKKNGPPTPRVVPIENIALPDYLRNPTAGICSDALLIVKKKKLIKDSTVNINVKKIKEQLCNTSDLQQKEVFLPKRKVEFCNTKFRQPYDLLTNLCRKNVSFKLMEMFKTHCVKKICPSRPNYLKLIGKVAELESEKNQKNNLYKLKRLEPRKLII